jgi:hypothetical protein
VFGSTLSHQAFDPAIVVYLLLYHKPLCVSDIDSSCCRLEVWLRYSDADPEVTVQNQMKSTAMNAGWQGSEMFWFILNSALHQ